MIQVAFYFGVLVCTIISVSGDYGYTNFVVTRFEHCEPHKLYPITFNVTIKTIKNKQYANGDVLMAVELGSNIRSNFSIELLTGKHYVYLFSITERNMCTAMHKYLGEFVYEVERNAQILPKTCPIAKGRYHVHNVELNYNRITLQTFPFGHLRFIELAYDNQNKLATCIVIEVNNKE